MVALRNPQFERISIVVNVVNDEAGAGECALHDEKEIGEKGSGTGDDDRSTIAGDNFSPSGGRCLEQTVVNRAVVSTDCQREPSLKLAQSQAAIFSES